MEESIRITKEVEVKEDVNLKLLAEKQVAEIYGFSLSTLRNWRVLRQGPRFMKINGKMIRYRINDIEDYLAACIEKTVDQRD